MGVLYNKGAHTRSLFSSNFFSVIYYVALYTQNKMISNCRQRFFVHMYWVYSTR